MEQETKKTKKSMFGFLKKNKDNVEQPISNNDGALMDMSNLKSIGQEIPNTINSQTVQSNEVLEGIKTREHRVETRQLFPFRYKVKSISGRKITGIFEAENIDDCRRFLELQGYTDIHIEPKKNYDIEINLSNKIPTGDLAFDLTQLSTYIKAGIPLAESVKILAQQSTKPVQRKAYQLLLYNLLRGDSLSDAMDKQEEVFPSLLINMVRTAEMTGDLPTILDDMADYYESIEKVRKEMKSAMTYPVIVIILAIGVLVFMLLYLVPQFVTLYEGQGATLPGITLFVIALSNFLKANYIIIFSVFLAIIVAFWYLYTRVKSFRTNIQIILMHVPVIGNIIIYKEVYNFTKTFASLLNHGVFITDSMEILSKITSNEIYKRIINRTMTNLAKGNSVSEGFKGEWAFPEIAYQMLVTGESTGQLGLMMEKVSQHYQMLHKTAVDQLKSMIEPAMILILAGIVGVLLLSIITPMFDIYNQIS